MTLHDLAIGVDVGGTNTDAVILDAEGRVLARTKQPTTEGVTGGIRAAMTQVLDALPGSREAVTRVMLGTTHATNAIVRRRDLGRVAVIRLGSPAATGFPPLTGWPASLKEAVLADTAVLSGGHMVDGFPITPLDPDEIRAFLDQVEGGFDVIAVCGIFSPSFPDQEREAEEIIRDHLGPRIPITLSQDIGAIGLLERENATILNAALYGVAREVTQALLTVVDEQGLDATTYFAQNDGTLMALDFAARFPVLTIGSGPANSIRGAAFLSGVENAIVVDIGGTTSDLGVVASGFPRESTLPREIGGVRTNFRMPDIISIGVGGGTCVDPVSGVIGPDSVGHRLTKEALLFGGDVPTLTDAAALTGDFSGSNGRRLSVEGAFAEALRTGLAQAHAALEEAVERLSLGRADTPLVVVGGGGFLVPENLPGAGNILRPENGDVANAVGAAISLIGGRAQQLSDYDNRKEAIEEVSSAAVERAIEAGADPLQVNVVDIVETPVSYSSRQAIRISAKAVGPLARLGSPPAPTPV